ncbi:MAG: hypothetical protein VB050_03205 [Geobacteraceae bacterium]|nr:hypothetical protein [Geobacteraceae bacterium]
MALTFRRDKGANLTPQEADGNTDEIKGLLTRLAQYVASQMPGANNIPVLDASKRLLIEGAVGLNPSVGGAGVSLGGNTNSFSYVRGANSTNLTANCYYDGTSWKSIAVGLCVILAATQYNGGGAVLYTFTATAADQTITWAAAQLMVVPSADTWTNITLLSGMASQGWETPAYRKQAATNDFQAKGVIINTSGSTISEYSPLFFVAEGYRPAQVIVRLCPMTQADGQWTTHNSLYYNSSTGNICNSNAIPNNMMLDLGGLNWFIAA